MPLLNMIVNGKNVAVDVEPHEYLAHVLREKLGLTGTKIGCEEAECGACTVLVNGAPVVSCIFPALKAEGARIETIEGLAQSPILALSEAEGSNLQSPTSNLHPLQKAFIEHGAVQCGFCTPGLIMAAKGLLDQNPNPTDDEIKTALKDNYCRCTGYVSVISAIKSVVASRQSPVASGESPNHPITQSLLAVVGKPYPRNDAVAKVTGAAKYTDDYKFAGMLHGATLRAKFPHAKILRLDATKAKALTGVRVVLTHEDVPGSKNHGLIFNDWPVLCYDKVRYQGDAVAIVAADAREIAERALELIEVEYEPLPVVDNPLDALKPDAIVVNDFLGHGNLLKHIKVDKGDIEQGFAQADVIVEREYHTPTYEHAFLEPECAIGRVTDDGRIEVYVGSQIPYEDRRQIAAALAIPESQVRVIGTLIGGGFGGKEDIMGQIHVALLARATKRPVKMLYSRRESMIAHPKRHATTIRLKTGAKRDGTLVAVRAEIFGDSGAYASLGDKVMTRAATHAAGPYAVPHVKIDCYAMYTNNPPAGAFRGFGVTQSAFAVESNMDILARELGMDPIELRRKSALRVGATTSTGQVVRDSAGLLECIRLVEAEVLKNTAEEQGSRGAGEKIPPAPALTCSPAIRAWGFAAAYKNTGLGGGAPDKSTAEVEVYDDGTAEIRSAAAEIGQGLPNVLAQITAEELGIPFERVRVLLSDTDLTPDGGPTTASRQTAVTGNAAKFAARGMREILARAASERLDAPPERIVFRDGVVGVILSEAKNLVSVNETLRSAQGDKWVTFADVVRWARAEGRATKYRFEYTAPETKPLGEAGDMHFAFSYAAQAALVEVNTETGEVRVLKVVAATDVGRAINPLALKGQVEGGIVMCLGNALTEEYVVEQGRVWTDRLARYKMPSIKHVPEIVSFVVEEESSVGPYGAKGVGEISSIPTTPAIINAIYNAVGVRVYALPVDQDKLLRAMKSGARQVR
ncbi:MAG: 2Fe-2S iron-sulfur cluster binding domain-containing protein [Chloroflexi bacterium]|nr:2Fe-2S iron-sulfur cluster binding domain-containing protein [Chloroflexota bacterium]